MLNKKKNNKQEKLKQIPRAGLLFFTYMLVLFAFLTLVACPDATTDSSGTNGSPGSSGMTGTAITTVQELKDIGNDLTGEYYLGNDVDISGAVWTPLGDTTTPFTGTLRGNGYTITGLTIGDAATTPATDGSADYQGLFGVINGATIDNLSIEVKHIYANAAVGALAGMVDSTNESTSTLINIAVSGINTSAIIQATGAVAISGSKGAYLGGVVGIMKSTGAISTTDPRHTIRAYNNGLKVEATATLGYYVGGIVGHARTSNIMGYATGDVSGYSSVGGQVGRAYTSTVSGYATGAVSGSLYVGGQVGSIEESTVSGYATGAVSGYSSVGGQVGYAYTSTVSGYATGAVSGTGNVGGQVGTVDEDSTVSGYATGAVSGTGNNIGGQAGSVLNRTTISGYATGAVSGKKQVGGQVGYVEGATMSGYATGAVSGTGSVGGQVGYSDISTVSGYARGTVTRTSGTRVTFGKLLAENNGGMSTINGFHSATESALLGTPTVITGIDGTAITMGAGITQATFSPATGALVFGTAVGEWTWVANGQWPAINIGDLGGNSASDKQPTTSP